MPKNSLRAWVLFGSLGLGRSDDHRRLGKGSAADGARSLYGLGFRVYVWDLGFRVKAKGLGFKFTVRA